jgi:outer membrane protein assembly factor BamE (lipoprotein component of BamABCDE complex)
LDFDLVMKRKRLLLIVACLTAVLLAGYVTLRVTAPKQHRITWENIDKIHKGMTEEAVEAVFGVPAGVYGQNARTGAYAVNPDVSRAMIGPDLIKRQGGKEWVGEDYALYIRFDDAGCVQEMHVGFVQPGSRHESFLDKLRRWLGM